MEILWFLIGLVLGGIIIWLLFRTRAASTRTALETKLKAAEEAQQKLSQTFDSLAASALRNNNESFLQLAKQSLATQLTQAQGDLDLKKQAIEAMVKPLKDSLENIEKERTKAYGGFENMTKSLLTAQETLAKETRNLSMALHTPYVRGRWGESTLRRVVELVGMVEHCDLLRELWGNGFENDFHLLHVNVSNLRRKIEPDPSRPIHIISEPGIGYRLKTE